MNNLVVNGTPSGSTFMERGGGGGGIPSEVM